MGSLATEGLPHLFSACFFEREGVRYAAFNHMGAAKLSIVRLDRFEVVKENSEHETAAAVFIGFAVMLYLLVR